jgi:hypothetical protein
MVKGDHAGTTREKGEIPMERQGLNEVEAGRFLGLARQSMANMRHKGVGPAYHKLGSRIVYKIADLEKYMAERRIDPEA